MSSAVGKIPPAYLLGAGLVAAALLWVAIKGAKGVGQSVGGGAVDLVTGIMSGADAALPEIIRPTSDHNIVNGAVSAVGGAITGQDAASFSLGSWLYELTNPGRVAAENQAVGR